MCAVEDVHQLHGNPHPVADLPHAALDDVLDAEFPSHLAKSSALSWNWKEEFRAITRNSSSAKLGDDVFE